MPDVAALARRFQDLALEANSEDALLYELCAALQAAAECDGCDLFLAEAGDVLVMRASTYTPEYAHRCRLGKGVGLCGQTHLAGKPVFLPERAGEDPRNVAYPGVDDRGHEALAALPLRFREERLGVALLFRREPWWCEEGERAQWQTVADELARTVLLFQHASKIGAQSSRIEAVSEVSRSIAASPYLEEILQLLVNITAQTFDYAVCTVRLLDRERGELVLRATQASARAYQRKPAIRLGESIAGRAIRENRPIVVPDVMQEPEYIGHDLAAEQGLCSMVCVPLVLQDETVGVMSCYTREVREFEADEVRALETIAKQAAYAIAHARLQVRNTLMQEMHHRVKNNLQQVASLLRLQIRHGAGRTPETALSETLGRILAISAVHEMLGREDLDHVGLRTLAENLIQLQRDALLRPDREIRFEVQGDDVHLSTQQATQVALVLNELLQNAVEHGFEQRLEGEIHVTVEDADREIRLWVANSGDPLPDGFSIAASDRLGLKIVDNLIRGMGGRFVLQDRQGWTVAEAVFTRSSGE